MTQKIALVDDDRNIVTSVKILLESEGYDVVSFHDGEVGLKGILDEHPDLCILDVKMPRMDGMELLTKLRDVSSVPVIFLTSKDDEVDQVLGLRLGADDYITKPFSQRLLIERVRSVLRRYAPLDKPQQVGKTSEHVIVRGDLELDDDRHLTRWKGQSINLTVTEYLLIKTLAISPGHVRTRDQLISAAYGESIYVDDRTIDTHVKRIRRKFRDVDRAFDNIETLYGIGYRYKES
ncbi:MAG TPA: response regulator transcription factor [Alphaproteobacteria bacterium]|nr:response regulator transcription factor [Alphaproteobacteria bacterium]HNS43794.1 response regulator transcription factor [Alphaproteobacteria bacterium]